MLRLHIDPVSTTCRPVCLFIHEEGMAVEMRTLSLQAGEQHHPDFLVLNPGHGVPVLEHDGFVLTESSAILKYLADLKGSESYPRDLKARARVNETMDWFNTGFYHVFGYDFVYLQVLDHYRWPDASQQRFALERTLPKVDEKMRLLDAKLAANGGFVCGATISLADYFGSGLISLADLVGFDLAPYRHVHAWLNRMKALPSWAPVHQAFEGWCAAAAGQEFYVAG